jgi:hypothetical protein
MYINICICKLGLGFLPAIPEDTVPRSLEGYYLLVIYFLSLVIFFCTYAFLAGLYGNIWYRFVIYISKHHHHQGSIENNSGKGSLEKVEKTGIYIYVYMFKYMYT